jgi:DtxR family Mn-dependent transcriptional regulator
MDELIEELLEGLWVQEEENGGGGIPVSTIAPRRRLRGRRQGGIPGGSEGHSRGPGLMGDLRSMEREGLVAVREDRVYMEEKGREIAKKIVRNHRLAERLLMEVFQVGDVEAEGSACKFEHILSPEVTDRVCTFLGHPPTCPHGKAIPRGECCRIFGTHIEPLVKPLTSLDVGRKARIVFLTPSFQRRLQRLGTLGLAPGGTVRLKQRYPSYVVEVDETTIALDREVGREIFVREVS